MPGNEDDLKRHYEAFPYPPRSSAAECEHLETGTPSHLLEVDHFIYGGRRDWSQPFRALVAGGGTGNAAIMLGQQLKDWNCPGEVVYLDLSTASREMAETRAKQRDLTNITFHTASLLDLPEMDLAPFDYIDCCGVLHHLPDPSEGLRALTGVLKPDGGMGIMLYGKYGRTGVYDIQSIMRDISLPDESQSDQLPVLKSLLSHLPGSNRMVQNSVISHDPRQNDVELVDRFLHSQDRAYTVEDIVEFCAEAKLRLASFAPPGRYDPFTYIDNENLRARFQSLNLIERACIAEKLCGNISKHAFYVVFSGNPQETVAQPKTTEAIPVLRNSSGPAMADKINPNSAFTAAFDDLTISVPPGPLAAEILRRIDGKGNLGDIYFDLARTTQGLTWPVFLGEFQGLYSAFHGLLNGMFLKFK